MKSKKRWFNCFDTDRKRGNFFVILGIVLYIVFHALIKKEFSLLYGIPGFILFMGIMYWFTTPEQRKLSGMFKIALFALFCIYLFFLFIEFFGKFVYG